jgi:hypothetical protein
VKNGFFPYLLAPTGDASEGKQAVKSLFQQPARACPA